MELLDLLAIRLMNTDYSQTLSDEETGQIKGMNPKCDKAQTAMLILIIIAVVCFFLLLTVTIRFCKTVGLKNKWMLLSFISFNIALILRIMQFLHVYLNLMMDCVLLTQCSFGFYINFNSLFFCCGVLFSMFNSLHLIKTLRQHLSMMKHPESANGLICLSITAVVLISGTFIASFVITCNANEQTSLKADDICRSIRVAIFLIECILFIVVGIKLDSLLSEFFTKRRGYVRFRLIAGVVLMAFPLFTNSIVNIFYIALRLRIVLNTGSIKANDYYYPIFMLAYYTITDLVPIGSLIILIKLAILHFESKTANTNESDISNENVYYLTIQNQKRSSSSLRFK